MKTKLTLLFISIIPLLSYAQLYEFKCALVDYEVYMGGGTFENVDGSGVDFELTGFYDDYCNGISIVTGINNGVNGGVIHHYHFTFSEPINIRFSISDINVSEEDPCYYDFLVFSGDPIFEDLNNVTSEGDTIIPMHEVGVPAYAVISYENVTSFTITHGDGGTICNPGIIYLSNTRFEPVNPTNSTSEFDSNGIKLLSNIVQDELILTGNFEQITTFYVLDLMGRKVATTFAVGEKISIDTSNLPNGHYLLYLEENNEMRIERFVVNR